jgi:predicted metal-dependent hydrolase
MDESSRWRRQALLFVLDWFTPAANGSADKSGRSGQIAPMKTALFRRVSADPITIDVEHAGQAFQVALRRRSTAKRITLRVSNATGDVVLTVPERTDLRVAQRFVDSHGDWIVHRLAKVPKRVEFRPGATVPLRGQGHKIVHWSGIRAPTQAMTAPTGEPIIAVAGDRPHLPRRIRDFLEAEAKRDLTAAVRRHTAKLGVEAKRITVRDTTSRWGSCSATGALSFSWRLILAPPFVLDYLAAHEVAHLRELNHSHRFWRLVHQLCPRTEEAERWLKRHGSELHRFG